MSTSHVLARVGAYELYADERSSLIEIGIYDCETETTVDTGAVFDSDAVLKIAIKLISAASYISDNPEEILKRLRGLIEKDSYLGAMSL